MITHMSDDEWLQQILADHEMSAVPNKYNPDMMTIHDCDGDEVINVTKTINPGDLRAFLVQRHIVWARGVHAGSVSIKAEFRKLIGAKAEVEDVN